MERTYTSQETSDPSALVRQVLWSVGNTSYRSAMGQARQFAMQLTRTYMLLFRSA